MENKFNVDVNEVISDLSTQVAQLTTDNAVLKSVINQYDKKVDELQSQLDKQN